MGTDAAASSDEVNHITDSISRLDVSGVPRTENDQNEKKQFPVPSKSECKCGMPLCICETEVETAPVSLQERIFLFIKCILGIGYDLTVFF